MDMWKSMHALGQEELFYYALFLLWKCIKNATSDLTHIPLIIIIYCYPIFNWPDVLTSLKVFKLENTKKYIYNTKEKKETKETTNLFIPNKIWDLTQNSSKAVIGTKLWLASKETNETIPNNWNRGIGKHICSENNIHGKTCQTIYPQHLIFLSLYKMLQLNYFRTSYIW